MHGCYSCIEEILVAPISLQLTAVIPSLAAQSIELCADLHEAAVRTCMHACTPDYSSRCRNEKCCSHILASQAGNTKGSSLRQPMRPRIVAYPSIVFQSRRSPYDYPLSGHTSSDPIPFRPSSSVRSLSRSSSQLNRGFIKLGFLPSVFGLPPIALFLNSDATPCPLFCLCGVRKYKMHV